MNRKNIEPFLFLPNEKVNSLVEGKNSKEDGPFYFFWVILYLIFKI